MCIVCCERCASCVVRVDVVGCVHDGVDQGQDKGEVAEGRLLA